MTVSSVGGGRGGSLSPAVSGMRDARLRLDVVAANVANANTDGYRPLVVQSSALPDGGVASTLVRSDLDGVDLATEAVNMIAARAAFEANARVLARTVTATHAVLDLLG